MNRRVVGNLGEDAACAALRRAGLNVLARNVRRPTGEIDIIAREGKTIAFVEVKARSSLRYGRPSEAVGRTAAVWLAENGLEDAPVRFDVVEVLPGSVRHLRAAFDATGLF